MEEIKKLELQHKRTKKLGIKHKLEQAMATLRLLDTKEIIKYYLQNKSYSNLVTDQVNA